MGGMHVLQTALVYFILIGYSKNSIFHDFFLQQGKMKFKKCYGIFRPKLDYDNTMMHFA